MRYYKIRTSGLRGELYLSGTWDAQANRDFSRYLRGTAHDAQSPPGDLTYLTSPGIGAAELARCASAVEPTLQSFVFPTSTVELIYDATSSIFEFVPIEVTASEGGSRSHDFSIVRFAEHRPFYDAERADEYALDFDKWAVTPFFEGELDFEFACQDPEWGIAIVNERFKKLLDPIIKLTYLKLDVELN